MKTSVNSNSVDMLTDNDERVSVFEWWDVLEFDRDMTVRETESMKIVGVDGVHLTDRANKCAASSLCIRFCGDEERWMETSYRKRRWMN
jgi:hypothetical protein